MGERNCGELTRNRGSPHRAAVFSQFLGETGPHRARLAELSQAFVPDLGLCRGTETPGQVPVGQTSARGLQTSGGTGDGPGGPQALAGGAACDKEVGVGKGVGRPSHFS